MKVKKKRGRPPLSPEEREAKRKERIKKANEYHKKTGYKAQSKYNASNPDILKKAYQNYVAKHVRITIALPKEFKPKLDDLITKTGLNANDLFIRAVEEKYNIKLSDK